MVFLKADSACPRAEFPVRNLHSVDHPNASDLTHFGGLQQALDLPARPFTGFCIEQQGKALIEIELLDRTETNRECFIVERRQICLRQGGSSQPGAQQFDRIVGNGELAADGAAAQAIVDQANDIALNGMGFS